VTTEAILNLLWATLCVAALASHFLRERVLHLKRAVSVLIASIALFPIVSASDDRLVLAALHAPTSQQTAAIESGRSQKASVLPSSEDPEHGKTVVPAVVSVVPLAVFTLAPEQTPGLAKGNSLTTLGRAPPLFRDFAQSRA
jgi:hypothetical protein